MGVTSVHIQPLSSDKW